MQVTHQTPSPDSYVLLVGKEIVAYARKTVDGFYAELLNGDTFELPTMKALKDKLAELADAFKGVVERRDTRPYYITVDDARKVGGMSHTMIAHYLNDVKQFHSYLQPQQWGAAIMKMRMELLASGESGEWAKVWLQNQAHRLPTLRQVDMEAWNRYREVRYLS